MKPTDHRSTPTRGLTTRLGALALGAALLALPGCKDENEIRAYSTPKETPGPVFSAPAMTGAPTAAAPAGNAADTLHWDLPEGWTELPGDDIRFATLTDKRTEPAMEVSVTRLPANANDLLANVNRWRGQLGLAPIEAGQLPQNTLPLEAKGINGIAVSLVGGSDAGEAQRMIAAIFETPSWVWFFKATGPEGAISAREDELVSLFRTVHTGAAHGPSEVVAAPSAAPSGAPELPMVSGPIGAAGNEPIIVSAPSEHPLLYTVPEGWREDPTPRTARLATLLIGDPVQAEMAITRFPGDVGGELANVNRWRGQLGLPSVASLDQEGGVDAVINGNAGRVYRIVGPGEGQMKTGILVAFVERSGHIWFFKLVGPIDLLDANRAAFDLFLDSIQFQGG